MELLQLKYFCDAAKTEKFSQTAKNFFVPVSNISQSIKRLESELGVELFNHRGNRVELNNEGQKFFEYTSQALAMLENGKQCVKDSKINFNGDIRLVCRTNYGIVTRAIEKFIEKYPKMNFIIHHNQEPGETIDMLISDSFPHEYRNKVLLFEDGLCVAMSKTHPLAKKERVSVKDLENERFITLTSQSNIKKITVDACQEAGFYPNIAIQTYDTSYLRRYISMGLGISITPAAWRKKHSDYLEFKELENTKRLTYAFLPKGTYTRECVKAFLEVLKAEAKDFK